MTGMLDDDTEDWLLDDDTTSAPTMPGKAPWKVLIVDDERDVHTATRLAVGNIYYKEKPLELLGAMSADEAYHILTEHPDIALILLDVVMETDDAGLKLVDRIRNELKNSMVRIVLRTGQPGQAPEQHVILNYDINDYKTKTELTVQKLFTTIIASLRAYENLLTIEKSRQGLSKMLDGASNLYQLNSLKEFASSVLNQISVILDVGTDGILCVENDPDTSGRPNLEVLAATGAFAQLALSNDLSTYPTLVDSIHLALTEKRSIYQYLSSALYINTQNGREFVIHFTPPWPLEEVEQSLLEIFCQRISSAYDNFYLYHQLTSAQQATVIALADLAEYRDTNTGEHVLRVQQLTDAIAQELLANHYEPERMTHEFMRMVGMASILHDVGKVGTPDHILFKPGKLDPEERQTMEQHAAIGANILKKASRMVEGVSYLSLGAEIAGGHHEHFNGEGYPEHLAGMQIPLAARIVAVVDVFDALLHKRPYKEPWTLHDTMEYIQSRAGTQFDPHIVQALVTLIQENRLPIEFDD